jgi:hypothetical protein
MVICGLPAIQPNTSKLHSELLHSEECSAQCAAQCVQLGLAQVRHIARPAAPPPAVTVARADGSVVELSPAANPELKLLGMTAMAGGCGLGASALPAPCAMRSRSNCLLCLPLPLPVGPGRWQAPVVEGCKITTPKMTIRVYQVSGYETALRHPHEAWTAAFTWCGAQGVGGAAAAAAAAGGVGTPLRCRSCHALVPGHTHLRPRAPTARRLNVGIELTEVLETPVTGILGEAQRLDWVGPPALHAVHAGR